MKKSIILKVISIVFALITILAIACAITCTGSGYVISGGENNGVTTFLIVLEPFASELL